MRRVNKGNLFWADETRRLYLEGYTYGEALKISVLEKEISDILRRKVQCNSKRE